MSSATSVAEFSSILRCVARHRLCTKDLSSSSLRAKMVCLSFSCRGLNPSTCSKAGAIGHVTCDLATRPEVNHVPYHLHKHCLLRSCFCTRGYRSVERGSVDVRVARIAFDSQTGSVTELLQKGYLISNREHLMSLFDDSHRREIARRIHLSHATQKFERCWHKVAFDAIQRLFDVSK